MRIVVVDMSFASMTQANYNAMKASGVNGVILHAGYGSDISQKDEHFDEAYKMAKAAGLLVGAYWFMYAVSRDAARREAEVCNEALAGCVLELGAYYDYEEDTIRYWGDCGVEKTDVAGKIRTFVDRMHELNDHIVGWYANPSCIRGKNGADAINVDEIAEVPFWLAMYNGEEGTDIPGTNYMGCNCIGHQFANMDCNPEWVEGSNNFDTSIFEMEIAEPQPAEEPSEPEGPAELSFAHSEGEVVQYDGIFNSSTSSEKLPSYYHEGTITKVFRDYPVANPYLIDGNTGWINDGCILGSEAPAEEPAQESDINEGDMVMPIDNVDYNGTDVTCYFDAYEVRDVDRDKDRCVLYRDGNIFSPFHISNLRRV